MILGQIELEPWHIYTGAFATLSYAAVRAWTAISKEKRESKRDEAHTEFLRRIANSTEVHGVSIESLNQKIDKEQEIRQLMHNANIEAQKHVCHFRTNP